MINSNQQKNHIRSPLICFFMLSTVESLKMLAKLNGYGFILEFVASNWYIFIPLTY